MQSCDVSETWKKIVKISCMCELSYPCQNEVVEYIGCVPCSIKNMDGVEIYKSMVKA